jgi:hypothetical protein
LPTMACPPSFTLIQTAKLNGVQLGPFAKRLNRRLSAR